MIEIGDILRTTFAAREVSTSTEVRYVKFLRVTDVIAISDSLIADGIRDYWDQSLGSIAPWLSDEFLGIFVDTVNITKRERAGRPISNFQGTNGASEGSPAQVAVEGLLPTKTIGRFGRMYLGPVVEAAHEDGELTAIALADFEETVSLFAGEREIPNDIAPVIKGEWGAARLGAGQTVLDFIPFEALATRVVKTARTQRRRTPGFGLT